MKNQFENDPVMEEVLKLADAVCAETLGPRDVQRLDDLLHDNPGRQQAYLRYMFVHAELHWLESSTAQLADPRPAVSRSSQAAVPAGHSTTHRWWAGLAAMTLALLGWWAISNRNASLYQASLPHASSNQATPDPTTALPQVEVAKVTGSLNCRWQTTPDSTPMGYGCAVYDGQRLELVEGIAEITFDDGTQMILQSPAKLDVAVSQSELFSGQLTATCPPGAEGFTVHAHGLKLIDRGTEFGVLADTDGNAEVHVFDGLVEGHYRENKNGPFRMVEWRTNQAARYDGRSNTLSPLDRSDTTFVRTLSSNLGPVSGLLACEDFDYPVGPLGGQNGGFGWGGPWDDVSVRTDLPDGSAVLPGSLRYGVLSSSGNHAALVGNFNRIRRVMSTSFNGVFDTAGLVEEQDGARVIGRDGTTLYLGFSQKVDALDQVFYGFELHRGDGNRNRVLCIGHGAARSWTDGAVRAPDLDTGVTGWAVTSELNGQGNSLLELGDLGPESTAVAMFVVKIVYGPNNVDTIEVFKNPASLWDESACQADVVGTGNFSFDRIGLANFEGQKTFEVDHIRLGTSFSGVTRPRWQADVSIEADATQ